MIYRPISLKTPTNIPKCMSWGLKHVLNSYCVAGQLLSKTVKWELFIIYIYIIYICYIYIYNIYICIIWELNILRNLCCHVAHASRWENAEPVSTALYPSAFLPLSLYSPHLLISPQAPLTLPFNPLSFFSLHLPSPPAFGSSTFQSFPSLLLSSLPQFSHSQLVHLNPRIL